MGKSLYPPGAIFCRTCGYCLHGLPEPRCPECGHGFDPADRKTFRTRPPGIRLKRLIVSGITLILVLAVAYGGLLTWLYAGWKAEAGAWRLMKGVEDVVTTNSVLPSAFSRVLVGRCREWQMRVGYIELHQRRLSPAEIGAIAACGHLRQLYLINTALQPEDLAMLRRCSNLEFLSLQRSAISNAGLAELSAFENLKGLDLRACPLLTDAALPHLARLKGLGFLDVSGTDLTPDAIGELRTALPHCHIMYR